jgi:hypothetical protein
MLGSKSQRGLTQLALDVIFRSIESNLVDCGRQPSLEASIQSSDPSEATITAAPAFLETVYSDFAGPSRAGSRAATPLVVRDTTHKNPTHPPPQHAHPQPPGAFPDSPVGVRVVQREDELSSTTHLSTPPSEMARSRLPPTQTQAVFGKPKLASTTIKPYMSATSAARSKNATKSSPVKGDYGPPPTPKSRLRRPSALPQAPDISAIRASCDPSAEYAIVICMYEVYNDRIFDLLSPPIRSNATKEYRRRPLLFKPTEQSPDRKVVAGLRKVVCGNYREALMVLEAGLHERRVAGTGSNSVSSRSHGFFCVEVKKRRKGRHNGVWGSSTLSIVDLAGSERARDAKTQGATLAEAGKINESLMYLGQCLQMQSDIGNTSKVSLASWSMRFRELMVFLIAKFGAVSSVQADRTAVLKLVPLAVVVTVVLSVSRPAACSSEGRHDCDGRSFGRLQRDIANSALQRPRQGNYCPPDPIYNVNHTEQPTVLP